MQKKTITKEEYAKRINTVIEFIANNLDREIELNELAEMSNFSPFHFHRIFKGIVHESIGAFIVRMRIETAARLLRFTSLPIQDIAYSIGYNSPSSLTKVFRQYYNISPTDYRNNKTYTIMKPLQLNPDLKIKAPKVVELEAKKAIYIRLNGDYSSLGYGDAWTQLWQYVKENKLYSAGIEHIAIYHNDPKITEAEKLRTDICLTIHKPVEAKGDIGIKEINGGKYAVFLYTGSYDKLGMVYDTIYGIWLPESGYQVRMEPGFEKYVNNPENTDPEKLKTEIYVPIE
ncbi:MAG: AraC family transcriptional regulator [Dysgonomonas sp.]|nr:AraC family transcriptional regulator [Dysgonomonas sp.]